MPKETKNLNASAFRKIELFVAHIVDIRWLTSQLHGKDCFYVFSNTLVIGIFLGVHITLKKWVVTNVNRLWYSCLKHVKWSVKSNPERRARHFHFIRIQLWRAFFVHKIYPQFYGGKGWIGERRSRWSAPQRQTTNNDKQQQATNDKQRQTANDKQLQTTKDKQRQTTNNNK